MKAGALALAALTAILGIVAFSAAVSRLIPEGFALRDAGFSPLLSAVPFIGGVLAGLLALVAVPLLEASKGKYGLAAMAVARVVRVEMRRVTNRIGASRVGRSPGRSAGGWPLEWQALHPAAGGVSGCAAMTDEAGWCNAGMQVERNDAGLTQGAGGAASSEPRLAALSSRTTAK
jgi:hypothetical protein